MRRLGIDPAAVVGNSMGGFIGAEVAIPFPTAVERLVLVSAAVFWQEYRRAQPLVALARTTDADRQRDRPRASRLLDAAAPARRRARLRRHPLPAPAVA